MELALLKKKISSYKTNKGRLTRVPDELAMEILFNWEQWTGPAAGFYSEIGIDFRKGAALLGRAKKLKREGFGVSEFKELILDQENGQIREVSPCAGIEIIWREGQLIRFPHVDSLVEFIKKVA